MRLTNEQITSYNQQGFLLLPNYFTSTEVDLLKAQLPDIYQEDVPQRVLENDHKTVRSVYGLHVHNEIFKRLVRLPRILEPATQLLNSQVYIHQFKINSKAAFNGDVWQWHQDYIFWAKEDGMPSPRAVNITIFLDEVNEFNGPMFFIPRTHLVDTVDVPANTKNSAIDHEATWLSNLTADLKYTLDRQTIASLIKVHGIMSAKGPSSSILLFHPNLVHGSPSNISPFDRTIIIITYNSIENIPRNIETPRPDFLASRSFTAVVPLVDDTLSDNRSHKEDNSIEIANTVKEV
ncbi:MAG TPA: phytanoyl-CoA dioxygenase family protein [Ktedonobacteraceae bacterium]|jgi:ectoine hydroxylase